MKIKSIAFGIIPILLVTTGGLGLNLINAIAPLITPVQAQTVNKAESFFSQMVGVKGVSRYDTTDYKGECVTLAVRYLQDVYFNGDSSRRRYGHGKDVARGVARQHSDLFTFKTKGVPKRGAIISFLGDPYNGTVGHVGIVLEARGDRFKMLESNRNGQAPNTSVEVSEWISYKGVVGWADPVGSLP
jgi:surface antigen